MKGIVMALVVAGPLGAQRPDPEEFRYLQPVLYRAMAHAAPFRHGQLPPDGL